MFADNLGVSKGYERLKILANIHFDRQFFAPAGPPRAPEPTPGPGAGSTQGRFG